MGRRLIIIGWLLFVVSFFLPFFQGGRFSGEGEYGFAVILFSMVIIPFSIIEGSLSDTLILMGAGAGICNIIMFISPLYLFKI